MPTNGARGFKWRLYACWEGGGRLKGLIMDNYKG